MLFANRKHLLLLMGPAFFMLCVFAVYPVIQIFIYSFLDVDYTAGKSVFIGIENYEELLDDWKFAISAKNTLVFSVVASLLQVGLGLLLALLFNREFWGKRFAMSVIIYPMMLSTLVCSAIWRSWYHYDFGLLNYILISLGLVPIEWLTDPDLALYSVILVDIWQWTPMTFLIMMAGMQSIPKDVLEAAQNDGAKGWRLYWYIILPQLKSHLFLALLLRTIDTFKIFDKVYALTGGGPGVATETLSMYVYEKGFKFFELGLASAASMVMLLIALALSIVYAMKTLKDER